MAGWSSAGWFEHRETLRRFFERFDILLTPTTPVTASPVGASVPPGYDSYPSWSFFTYPFNLTGQPAATLPCGMSRSGLPIGLQIVVPPQREDLLVVFLAAAEQCLGSAEAPRLMHRTSRLTRGEGHSLEAEGSGEGRPSALSARRPTITS